MPHYLTPDEMRRTMPAERAFPSPIPTQIVSNGEFTPLPQTREQRRVEARIEEMAETLGPRHGLSRRQFLASAAGMAAAFLAMNETYGPLFDVSPAEASQPGVAAARADALAGQFIFDVQTHFVRDDFRHEGLLDLAKFAKANWNPGLWGETTLARYKFENYVKEIFVDSDTKVALLSGAPFDDPTWDLLSNEQIAAARTAINRIASARRLLGHAIFTPRKAGWMDQVDRAIALKPDSWKGYTIGDPLFPSKLGSYWRLDDEKLVYPFYEKIVKAGIPIVCIHKGLLPADYEKSWPNVWQYNTVWDLGKAAKDNPQVTFVIYHAALRAFLEKPDAALQEFEQTGRIKWATDLAELPSRYGVSNVYAEIGTAFANSAVASPRFAAAFLGTLVRGMGADHVLWGTDSVWYGSPQWQIEALRRLEIPEDMRRQHGFAPLGPADGLVKTAIFGANAARLYNVQVRTALGAITRDRIAAIRAEYVAAGGLRSNQRYGYVATRA
ncbi:MAG TPA: amidohydrolase family protein [Candidatus Tectomicrobia bacterium]|nr:amidohydrolase family protein [Candidatus Tectomicrobia bacterium]